ncbi:MAG: hypothetical protein JSV17_04920 [Candidatus Aminicenantes bacterium]|nr:MAG: hypothetical protein JSV17_04920 [Candidatus Aminicenantes bacterium]
MKIRFVICFVLCLTLVLGSCGPGEEERDKIEPAETEQEPTEMTRSHIGGCILAAPAAEVPADLYQITDVVPTEEYKPFTKKLSVYGFTLIGREDITDDFMRKVAKTIKEMFPQNEVIEAELQKEVLRNLYRYRTVIPLFRGHDYDFSPGDQEAWDLTTSQNSICDIIMEGVSGQVNEVVEHILHWVSDVGLHYTFPDEWGCTSKTSKIYHAMQEAIDKGHYNIEQYDEAGVDEEERIRVLIQEYAYWVIFTAWDLYEPYGPEAEWTGIKNPNDLREKLPLSYDLFQQTIPRVMAPPSRSTLEEFTK